MTGYLVNILKEQEKYIGRIVLESGLFIPSTANYPV